jgi:hypothetical protein
MPRNTQTTRDPNLVICRHIRVHPCARLGCFFVVLYFHVHLLVLFFFIPCHQRYQMTPNATILRGLFMYTCFNWLVMSVYMFYKNNYVLEFIRSSSLLIFIGVVFVILGYGYSFVIDFYKRHYMMNMPIFVIMVIDFAAHILPLQLYGPPHNPHVFLFAFFTMILWYSLVRQHLHHIYFVPKEDLKQRDIVVYYVGFLVALIIYFLLNHMHL